MIFFEPNGTTADLVARVKSILETDHKRGCQGREYSCDCDHDDNFTQIVLETIDHIASLEAEKAAMLLPQSEESTRKDMQRIMAINDDLLAEKERLRSPNMLWNADCPDDGYVTVAEMSEGIGGEESVFEVQCAHELPNMWFVSFVNNAGCPDGVLRDTREDAEAFLSARAALDPDHE